MDDATWGGIRKVVTMQYTEHVYYDLSGQEVSRERIYDDATYDEYEEHITLEELEERR